MSQVSLDIDWLRDYQELIDTSIEQFFDKRYDDTHKTEPERLFEEAMRHAVMSGGKRLRPILMLLGYEIASGKPGTDIVQGAIGLEFMHCYTLVHDDLPCMDNDVLRRGQPTVWKKYGEYTGVLVGDALQSVAFEALASLGNTEIIRLFAESLGDLGVVRGQIKDMQPEKYMNSTNALLGLHRQKTGLFLENALEIGAILGWANATLKEKLKAFGASIGLLFQIQDDILDYEWDPELLGKSIGKDREQKKGLVGLLGIEETRKLRDQHLERALQFTKEIGSDKLEVLARFIALRQN